MSELELRKNLNYVSKKSNFENWFSIVKPILLSAEFQKRLKFKHHHHSVFFHSVLVSYNSFEFALKHNINSYNCAIAGLLHDFYPYPWQYSDDLENMDQEYLEHLKVKKSLFKKHGFTHAREALDNTHKYFSEYSNERIDNAILRHMFPLNIAIPKYSESWVVTLQDKIVSIKELGKMYD